MKDYFCSWTWVLPSRHAQAISARRPRTVGRGPFVFNDTQFGGNGKSKRHQTRQKVQPDDSSDTLIWLWDPSLHPLHYT